MADEKPSFKIPGPEAEVDRIDVKDETISGASSPQRSHEFTLWERQRDPYLGKSEDDVVKDAEGLIQRYSLDDFRVDLLRGVRYAYNRDDTDRLEPTHDEKYWIEKERSPNFKDKWAQTKTMYFVARESRLTDKSLASLTDVSSPLWFCRHRPRHGPDCRQWRSDVWSTFLLLRSIT